MLHVVWLSPYFHMAELLAWTIQEPQDIPKNKCNLCCVLFLLWYDDGPQIYLIDVDNSLKIWLHLPVGIFLSIWGVINDFEYAGPFDLSVDNYE